MPRGLRPSAVGALSVAIAYGAGLWLVLVHHAEGGHEHARPGLVAHWLRDATLSLPGVVAAVWLGAALALRLASGARPSPPGRDRFVVAAGAALAAAIVLGAGSPLHGWLFGAEDGAVPSPALHAGRDALIALAAALPLALTGAWLGGRPGGAPTAGAAPEPPPAHHPLTRRALVGYGAGALAGAGVAGAVLTRRPRAARAAAGPSDRLQLFVNDGHVAMVDGTLVYARGYGRAPAGDPAPSLAISPAVFRRDHDGPVASRFYPLVGDDRLPPDGAPADAGPDPGGGGLRRIRRRHWASYFPPRTIVAESGSELRLRITNRLREPHTFTIDGVVDVTLGPAGSPSATKDVEFPAPAPGTYVYHDTANAPVNRVLGLHGVLVVVPADNPWTLDGSEGEFERQWLWIVHDVDPAWARRARLGATIDPEATPSAPRYFTLNGRSGVYSLGVSPDEDGNHRTHEDTTPAGRARAVDVRSFSDPATGTGQLIRMVNTGVAVHQPHFHGNHVWTIAVDNRVMSRSSPAVDADGHIRLQHWEDVIELDPMQTKAVMLPLKLPPDALDDVVAARRCDWIFPMHCHAEMSQTAGGGLYPGGLVSDWKLKA